MLNLFPIQWLALVAYFILRLGIGGMFLYYAKEQYRHRQALKSQHIPAIWLYILIAGEVLTGFLFIIGFVTQAAAIVSVVISSSLLTWSRPYTHTALPPRPVLVLLITISLCLFITGAGVVAVDLPI
jgi:uncharacterized membrane protein YphA (DoxX/SURF4 family)